MSELVPQPPEDNAIPLSFAQNRLWFLNQLQPESAAYHALDAVRLHGLLNVRALVKSLNHIMSRHDVLRTRFVERDGEVLQVVTANADWPVSCLDWSELPNDQRNSEIRRFADQEQHTGFSLESGSLISATVIRLGPEDHVLFLRIHHIVADGWSIGILHQELELCYESLSAGRQPDLPALPCQYADFAAWQRSWLTGPRLAGHLEYWRQRLRKLPPLNLMTDRPVSVVRSDRGGSVVREIPLTLFKTITSLSRQTRTTPFMVLLAAFQILLARYSGQTDFAVGTPIANRGRKEWEGLMGFFVNSLVMRAELRGDPGFIQYVEQVRDLALEAYSHQDLPFEMLVQELAPERDPGRNPLFQVTFGLHNLPSVSWQMSSLKPVPVDFEITTSRFDLELNLWQHADGLRLVAFFSKDLFEHETAARILQHYERLLQGIAATPDRRLSELSMLTDTQRRNVLSKWNLLPARTPVTSCLHQLFQQQAARNPGRIALSMGEVSWSYAELEARASAIADQLRNWGVSAETPVAICMFRAPEMIAAILGVLMAGGAYVPLEPGLPGQRLAWVLQETNAQVILAESAVRQRLSEFSNAAIYCLDTGELSEPAPSRTPAFRCAVAPENLAYLMYTSGSAGRPKAVQISHGNVVQLIESAQSIFEFGQDDVWTLFHSYAFDFSVWEIWGSLLTGGRLVIVPSDICRSPVDFLRLLDEEQVTVLNQTPTVFGHLMQERRQRIHSLCSLKWIIFGGERLDSHHVAGWMSRYGDCQAQLVNMYGITECTVHATYFRMTQDAASNVTTPIGVKLPRLQIYILDSHGQIVPPGVPGEICLGGDGLSRGYWGNPSLTAARFVPHPFSEAGGARLFLTGDRGRFTDNGVLEYLGRNDAQVKIRGIRIEPGEIEAALRKVAGVQDALVVRDAQSQGEHRLVAYLVFSGNDRLPVDILQRSLSNWLPQAMIPSSFISIKAIPRTAQGKVDLQALPKADDTRPQMSVEFVAPRTPVEHGVAEIWEEVLKLDRVGVYDNFFDLGGHSLQATRVASRIRDAFQVEFPLHQMFAAPVLAEIAARVESALRSESFRPEMALRPGLRRSPPRLSFSQQRLWFLCKMRPDSGAYHIPMVIEIQGHLNVDALQRSVNAVIHRHEALRTVFPCIDGQPVQEIAESRNCPLEIIDCRGLPVSEQDEIVRIRALDEQDRSFDLESGPLLRTCLFQMHDRFVLIMTIHHIISDGWSIGILRRELAEFYEAFRQNTLPLLPPLSLQYADFSEWQRTSIDGDRLRSQLDYWQKQLTNLSPLQLPTDWPRPAVLSDRGGIEILHLPATLRACLTDLNRREGVTLFITMLAAFQALLMKYSHQTDIVVGSPIANRGSRQIEGLIGFFVNTLVFRTHVAGNLTFRQLLHEVRRTALEAYTHQDVPFERLVEELHPERTPDQNPLFQVMFTVQNSPVEDLQLPGVSVRSLPYPVTTTRFDLQWDVLEQSGDLQIVAYFRSQLFRQDTIQRMLRHYATLLQRAIAEPDRCLSDLSMLDDDERCRILIDWNPAATESPPESSSIHQLFAAQAARIPDAVAIVDEDEQRTYRDLNERATQLASLLSKLGVRSETRVGLCVDRNCDMVAAMIGVLKAGGAYVPLDPEFPPTRLQQLMEQAEVSVLIVSRQEQLRFKTDGIAVVCLNELRAGPRMVEDDADDRVNREVPDTASASLACVMFTSGSTGLPKGVGVPHLAIVRLVTGSGGIVLTEQDVVAQASNPTFDAATFEIWGALLSGGRLVMTPREKLLSPVALDAHLRQHSISVLFLTTALFNELIHNNASCFSSLRCLLFGGESVNVDVVRRAIRAGAPEALLHMYGPTEATTFATAYRIERITDDDATVPIGKPLPQAQVYLLDSDLQPVPAGVTGEIYLGGSGLTRGYLNDAAATAERFIPHPWPTLPGQRLYRTGDLGRYRPDGNIEFLTRSDEQIKLRGFRIEPGEVRNSLLEYPGLRDCHIAVCEKTPGNKLLVAYLTLEEDKIAAGAMQRELISDWSEFYDDLYRNADPATDARLNLAGWTSSYTGRPISAMAMREQVDWTVDRIRRHHPRRVLEIGCGTGLLLFRIAPICEHYLATDISPVAVDWLQDQIGLSEDLRHVEIFLKSADESMELVSNRIDAVIMNSVVQYFPGIAYLRTVLQQAATVVAPGGIIFLGDVRSLCLWEAFQTTVELLRAPRSMTIEELRQRVVFEMEQETELLIHPAFFCEILHQLPGAVEVRIEPKRGALQNELIQFRYDVTIRFGTLAETCIVDNWHDWNLQPLSLQDIRERLIARPGAFGLMNVANARVSAAVAAVQELTRGNLPVSDLRNRLTRWSEQSAGLDPEDLWSMADELGYEIDIDWSEGNSEGRFRVIWKCRTPGTESSGMISFPQGESAGGLRPAFSNRPLEDRVTGYVSRQLREHLKQRLPEYMIPSAFTFLPTMPLTPHGKIDSSRLPAPQWPAAPGTHSGERPRTGTEETLAGIWCEVLRISNVGLHDNFFDLGGHSLLAMQVVIRIRERFFVDVPVRCLFEAPTVSELAVFLTQHKAAQVDQETLLRQLEELETMTDEQVRERFETGGPASHD